MAPGTIACMAALLATLHFACCGNAAEEVGNQASQKDGDAIRIGAEQMHQLDIVKVESHRFRVTMAAVGRISFNEDATTPVFAPFSGRVTRLVAKIGDTVERGDPLFEIDSPEVALPQNEFVAALAAVNKARSQLNLAQVVEKRQRDLYEGKAVPLKEWQQSQADLVNARNDVRGAETALDAARNRLRIIGLTDAQIAALQQGRAIGRTVPVFAPIDGTVIARRVGPRQYVRSDAGEPLYTIAGLSTMWLKALVPENGIPLISVGQEIEVKVTALPDRVFRTQIAAIDASSDPATRRVVVRAEIPNPDGALKAEMFASFKIATSADQITPSVPVDAVIREGEAAFVWTEVEPLRFQRRQVEVGLQQDRRMQIVAGLKTGERVVGRGVIFVDNEWRQ